MWRNTALPDPIGTAAIEKRKPRGNLSLASAPPCVMQRGSVAGRLLKWFAFTVLAWVLLTSVLVMVLRWMHPLTSTFMLEARVGAYVDGNSAYRTRFEWVNL